MHTALLAWRVWRVAGGLVRLIQRRAPRNGSEVPYLVRCARDDHRDAVIAHVMRQLPDRDERIAGLTVTTRQHQAERMFEELLAILCTGKSLPLLAGLDRWLLKNVQPLINELLDLEHETRCANEGWTRWILRRPPGKAPR